LSHADLTGASNTVTLAIDGNAFDQIKHQWFIDPQGSRNVAFVRSSTARTRTRRDEARTP